MTAKKSKDNNEEGNQVKNPDTADLNILGLLGMMTLGIVGIRFTMKHRKFN